MAKRTTPRSQADASADAPSAAARRPRTRENRPAEPDQAIAGGISDSAPTTTEELPNIPEPGDVADQAQRSESIVTEPSEEEIRLRAYHRYLERGGGHGKHFDDWLEAERDLKRSKA